MAGKLRTFGETPCGEHRNASHLATAPSFGPRRIDGEGRLIVLYIDAPGNARVLQAVEDQRDVAPSADRNLRLAGRRLGSDGEKAVRDAAALHRGKPVVEQHRVVCELVEDGQILWRVVTHSHPAGVGVRALGVNES